MPLQSADSVSLQIFSIAAHMDEYSHFHRVIGHKPALAVNSMAVEQGGMLVGHA
jgi:hypothetical protein